MSIKSFSTTMANALSQSEQRRAYDRHTYRQSAAGMFKRRWASEMPSILSTRSARRCGSLRRARTARARRPWSKQHSRAPSRTDFHEFPKLDHWLIAEPGWEEVADTALKWAEVNAKPVGIASNAP
jgi:hypothetical protein